MTDVTLYTLPGSCGRVTATALFQAGLNVDARLVNMYKGEHKTPEYRAINPISKVPAIVIDGRPLTENPAIIMYLHAMFPAANLMPAAQDAYDRSRLFADLNFCSATLHPIVTRIRMTQFFADDPAAQENIKQKSMHMMAGFLKDVETRLTDRDWWYGDSWSMMDSYLEWITWRSADGGFDMTPFPHLLDMVTRAKERPAAIEARRIEAELGAQMAAAN